MAVESRIDADDQWFVGEDRVFRFTLAEGNLPDLATWGVAFNLFERRAKPDAAPLLTAIGVGYAPAAGVPGQVQVTINGDDTLLLEPGLYQFVLARTDFGLRQILSYGPAELQRAINA